MSIAGCPTNKAILGLINPPYLLAQISESSGIARLRLCRCVVRKEGPRTRSGDLHKCVCVCVCVCPASGEGYRRRPIIGRYAPKHIAM